MKTVCEKCIFADYASAEEPCKIHIIEKISEYHKPYISDNNFYAIDDYYCRYGFNLDVYDQNKNDIGTIDNLKQQLHDRAKIRYYMVIEVTNPSDISTTCNKINELNIKPAYVSFLLHRLNNTDTIISSIKNTIDSDIEWKIHNFLEDIDINSMISTVFDTNAKKKDTVYFWINKDDSRDDWQKEIDKINYTIYILQPKCHGLFRSIKKDGMFLSFDLYKQMKANLDSDIFKALEVMENPNFIYYA